MQTTCFLIGLGFCIIRFKTKNIVKNSNVISYLNRGIVAIKIYMREHTFFNGIKYLSGLIRKTLLAISTASVIWPDFLLHLLRFNRRWTVRVSKVDLFLLKFVSDGIRRRAYWYLWAASFNFSFLNKVLPSSRSLFSSNILM